MRKKGFSLSHFLVRVPSCHFVDKIFLRVLCVSSSVDSVLKNLLELRVYDADTRDG